MFTTGEVDDKGKPIIDQQQFFNWAEDDKVQTMEYAGGGYYQCYCKKFSDYHAVKSAAAKAAGYNKKGGEVGNAIENLKADNDKKLKLKTNELCYNF